VSVLDLIDVRAALDGKDVLKSLSLSVSTGEVVAICGPNGAGKSSLLKVAAGLLKPKSGRVLMNGKDSARLSSRERGQHIAYLAQERAIAWNMPAIEIAALGGPFLSGSEVMARAQLSLSQLGIGHLADRGVGDMSGGERARVLLARALVSDAPLLLADEPVAGLDPDAALLVLEVLQQKAQAGKTVVLTLHDLSLAAQYADRVVVVAEGRIVADAKPQDALSPETLKRWFRISGHWVENENGPLLATRRLS